MLNREPEENMVSAEDLDQILDADMFSETELEQLVDISGAEFSAENVGKLEDPNISEETGGNTITPDMAGVWFDGSRGGVAIGKLIQQEAQAWGWTGIADTDPESDGFWDAVGDAEEYMNDLAPDGYYFSNLDEGDWGLFALESDDEVVTPAAAPQEVKAAEDEEDEEAEEELTPAQKKALEEVSAHPVDESLTDEERAKLEQEIGAPVADELSEEDKKAIEQAMEEPEDEDVVIDPKTGKPAEDMKGKSRDKTTETTERMKGVRERAKRFRAEPNAPVVEMEDSPVTYFSISITPPAGSPFQAKSLQFVVDAPDAEVEKMVQNKVADLTREYQSLDPEMKIELSDRRKIQNADVIGKPDEKREGKRGKGFGRSEEVASVGELHDKVAISDVDDARANKGVLISTWPTSDLPADLAGGSRAPGSGRGFAGKNRAAASLQLKGGQLLWAADDTVTQKPLPAGYRWVKVGDSYVQMKDEEAATLASIVALNNVTIASEFRDILYPIKAQDIKEGDRVYVRPLKKLATVVDIKGSQYTVATTNKLGIYWASELEVR